VYRIERHGQIPEPKLISKIAVALDINEEELFKVVRKEKIKRYEEKINNEYKGISNALATNLNRSN
jgi:hypothetical protein